jgi:hypothetical protein
MKTAQLLLAGALMLGMNAYAQAPPVTAPPATAVNPAGAQTITGELLKIERETYVIRDGFGKEVRLRVDQNSKIEGSPKVGDRIEAKVLEGGWASSVSKQ